MLATIFSLTDAAAEAATGIDPIALVLGIILMVLAVLIIVAVLLQSGKDKSLSGSISGSAETFFSKSKSGTMDKILGRATLILSIIFAIICVVMYIIVSK